MRLTNWVAVPLMVISLLAPCLSEGRLKGDFRSEVWTDVPTLRETIQQNPNVVHARHRGETDRYRKHMNGWTLLHFSSRWGHEYCARLLLEKGADPNAKADDGSTPLHVACEHGDEEVVKFLLAGGADPNARNEYGSTPLHNAANHGCTRALTVLLQNGADPTIKDKTLNKTPLELAVYVHRDRCAEILRNHMAAPQQTTAVGNNTPPVGRYRIDTSSPVAATQSFYDGLNRQENVALWGLLSQKSRTEVATQMGKLLPKYSSQMNSLMGSNPKVAGVFWSAMQKAYVQQTSGLSFAVQDQTVASAVVKVSGGGEEQLIKTFKEGGRWRVGLFETFPFDLAKSR